MASGRGSGHINRMCEVGPGGKIEDIHHPLCSTNFCVCMHTHVSFTFASDPDQHICEVQLVHAGMLTARKHCNAHTMYSKFRSALELLETFGLGPEQASSCRV